MSAWRMQYWSLKLLSLAGLTVVVFALPHLMLESPLELYASWSASADQQQRLVASYGLDRPLLGQYTRWLHRIVTGQWGSSRRFSNQSVWQDAMRATGRTLALLAWTLVLSIWWIGLWWMVRRVLPWPLHPRRHDILLPFIAVLPNFVVALLLRDVLVWELGWLTLAHIPAFAPTYLYNPLYMFLPATALALTPCAIWKATRHPLATPASRSRHGDQRERWERFCLWFRPFLAALLLQVFLTENILLMPGLGTLGLRALKQRDIPMLQGFLLCASGLYFMLQLVLDWGARLRQQGYSPLASVSLTGIPQRPSRRGLHRGVFGLVTLLAVAVWASSLSPYDPTEIHSSDQLLTPGYRYILGTDFLGRDVFSRTVEGFRSAIPRALLVTVLAGSLSGLLLALGLVLPSALRRSVHAGLTVLYAIPPFLLMFIAFLVVEHHDWALDMALIISLLPLAAQLLASPGPVLDRITSLAQLGGQALLLAAAFGFLNIVPDSSMPTWGSDIRFGKTYGQSNLWILIAPSLALVWSHYNFHLLSHTFPSLSPPSLLRSYARTPEHGGATRTARAR